MKNKEVADILYEIADLLEMQDVQWKPRAYRKAARKIEGLTKSIEEIHQEDKLQKIDGVGEAIAEKISEYLETGKLQYYEDLKKELPVDIEALTNVEGLGPKKAQKLYKALNITNLDELEQAAKAGDIAKIDGFGEKTEENILSGIELAKTSQERMLLGKVDPIAKNILEKLKESKHFNQVEIAGSYRRRRPTVGDIDILATSNNPKVAMEEFCNMEDVEKVVAQGETKSSIIVSGGLHMDLRIVEPDSYGSALQYFTGSKDHNVKVRSIAVDKGWKLNEYGLFDKNDKKLADKTEEEIYNKLGLDWIPPELRTDTGEIEAAQEHNLPKLIETKQIKGDLQMHTKYSDGSNTILEMTQKAEELGYEYIATTDHGPTVQVAGGMNMDGFKKQRKEIDKVNEQIDITVLQGVEADVINGGLDISKQDCEFFDIVLASMHNKTKNPTEDLVKVFNEWPIDIWAHPLNRLVNKRAPTNLDLDKVIKAAAENNVAVEINAHPERLDLPWNLVKKYRDKVKFIISTDSHSTDELENMHFGVEQARRGWCEKENILNTKPLNELVNFLTK